MTKRTLLSVVLCCASSVGALGQTLANPWNCANPSNNHLICLVPLATRSQASLNTPAPTFNSSFAAQLSQLPLLSSGSGIVLTGAIIQGQLVYVTSDNLGPILTERAQTIGKHRFLVAFAYQRFRFTDIDGTSLKSAPFVFNYIPSGGASPPYSVYYTQQNERIDLNYNQYVILGTFGLTSKTDISFIVPFGRVSLGSGGAGGQYQAAGSACSVVIKGYCAGTQYQVAVAQDGTATPVGQAVSFPITYLHGSASGIGDVQANIKQVLWSGEKTFLSAGLLLRFPTGDALNYLGSGAYGFNPYAAVSYQARLSPHARIGYQFNTTTVLLPTNYDPKTGNPTAYSNLPGGLQYDFGADYVLFKKVPTTVAGDFLGNHVTGSPLLYLQPFGSAQLTQAWKINPPALSPGGTNIYSYYVNQLSIGAKVKPWKSLILYGNVLFQLNNVGLRSEPVPLVGVSYTFGK